MRYAKETILIVALLGVLLPDASRAQSWKTLLDLEGRWKFELGDDPKWADPRFQDGQWDNIYVPSPWEDEGYPGYDGYAWYRKHFRIDKKLKDAAVFLLVGYVDDVSEVYLNGHMIGFQGIFPPDFVTAYNISEQFFVPQQYLNYDGDNVVAVRVYDYRLAGGITRGNVGLFEPRDYLKPEYDLSGMWKFKTGDDESWKSVDVADDKWTRLMVPGFWETQGFRKYDGFAWYRMKFRVPDDLARQRLILLLGKVDDFDETYLNGERIGRTGTIRKDWSPGEAGKEYSKLRAYVIPPNLLVPGKENVIAVRVLDVYMHGGIYEGPVGLVTRNTYQEWDRDQRGRWNPFDWFR